MLHFYSYREGSVFQMSNSWSFIELPVHPLLTEQPVVPRAELEQRQRRRQQSSGCVFGPQRAETDEKVKGSYSPLTALHKSK